MNKTLTYRNTIQLLFLICLSIVLCGCENNSVNSENNCLQCFAPESIKFREGFCRIEPEKNDNCRLIIYCQIVDRFGDSMKMPGKFRIELYGINSQIRPNDQGSRLAINDDGYIEFDLTDQTINNSKWDSITNSYQLEFTITNVPQELISHVTWLYTDNYRLENVIKLAKSHE